MTGKRKILVIIAAAGLILAAAFAILWTNLDWIVENAIERYGSQATGTRVRVRGVALNPVKGRGVIEGLTVANPHGYSAPHILSLGAISVRIEPRSIASNPVVIDDIRITSPLVVYETNEAKVANVDVLKKNLGAYRPEKPATRGKKGTKEEGKRLRIRHLVIENAKAEVRVAALGDKPRIVTLGRIEMTDIGGKNGAPPEEVAKQIVTAILSEVSKEVGKAGASKLLENAVERALKRK
ncbi:MAG: hypothetical protein AABZ15_02460 [Nitrospirota bacterium]